MFFKWFGSRKRKAPPRDVKALVQGLARPAVQIVATERLTDSFLGGLPRAPAPFVWPEKAGLPLGFLAQLNLADLARVDAIEWLPRAGHLFFFYDFVHQPWGFDPRDRGSWAVVHVEEGQGPLMEHPAPAKLPGECVLGKVEVELRRIDTFPTSRESLAALALTDEESDLLLDLQESQFSGRPRHQMGGFPSPVQGSDMELECQLASQGLYCGDERGYKDPRARDAARSAHEWKLLLQMDSDDDLKVMWGDLGMLYFWNRERDSRAGKFDDAWVVLQCH